MWRSRAVRAAMVVAELETMVVDEPLRRTTAWAMLMLALDRCGRQADALRTYQRARTLLGQRARHRARTGAAHGVGALDRRAGSVTGSPGDERTHRGGRRRWRRPDRGRRDRVPAVQRPGRVRTGGSGAVLRSGGARCRARRASGTLPVRRGCGGFRQWEVVVGARGSVARVARGRTVGERSTAEPRHDAGTASARRARLGALAIVGGCSTADALDRLMADPGALNAIARERVAPGERFVIVVDQLEELHPDAGRSRASAVRGRITERWPDIAGATVRDRAPGRLLRSLRRLPRAAPTGHWANTCLLGPMDPPELMAAIEGPANVAGLRLEPGLNELIVREVRRPARPALPVALAHAARDVEARSTADADRGPRVPRRGRGVDGGHPPRPRRGCTSRWLRRAAAQTRPASSCGSPNPVTAPRTHGGTHRSGTELVRGCPSGLGDRGRAPPARRRPAGDPRRAHRRGGA